MAERATRTLPATWSRESDTGEMQEVNGALVISDKSPTHMIHLAGDFGGFDESISFFTGAAEVDNYPILYGQTEEGYFTAIDSKVTSRNRTWGGGQLPRILAQPSFVIKGSTLLREEELAVTEVKLRFWDQNEWAEWSDIKIQHDVPSDGSVTFTQSRPKTASTQFRNATFSMDDATPIRYLEGQGSYILRQDSIMRIKFDEPVELRDFMANWMRPLAFWVSSGTKRTTGIQSMSITNEQWVEDGTDEPIDVWLQVIPRNPRRPWDEDDRIDFLHHFRQFDLERQLALVFKTFEQHQLIINQYLNYLHAPPATPLAALIYLVQLVEGFDRSITPDPPLADDIRQASNDAKGHMKKVPNLAAYAEATQRAIRESVRPTLATRLTRLDDETGNIVTTALERDDWVDKIALVRNAITHGLPRAQFFVNNSIPVQVAIDILELLFEMRLLVALGFSIDEVRKMVTIDDIRWWQRMARIMPYLSSFDDFADYKPLTP